MNKLIQLDKLQPGMVAATNILPPKGHLPIVLRNTLLTNRMISLFGKHGLSRVLVEFPDPRMAEEVQLKSVAPILDETLLTEAVSSIRHMFDAVSNGISAEHMTTAYQAVNELDQVVDRLVDSLTSESNVFVHISGLRSYDEYTYHHSLSVAVLSIAIGQSMRLTDGELRLLGRCAILHDIGKILVPAYLINKPARLNDTEFSIVQAHPLLGYNYLLNSGIGTEDLWNTVSCHHEKLNGTGYPDGLKGSKIPFMSRIISVADVFDAITSYRSYRSPMPPAEAMELMMSEVGTSFEFDIINAFINKIEIYPINSCVELSNKRCGIVIDNHCSMRPVIQMLDNEEIVDLMSRKNLNLVVTRIFDKIPRRLAI